MNTPTDPLLETTAALYWAGALTDAETAEFEQHLAAGHPEASAAVRALEGAARALVNDAAPVAPSPSTKDALLAKLPPLDLRAADRAAAADVPGVLFRFAEESEFRQTPFPGVRVRMLHVDRPRRQFTCLMRLDPGAVYPSHPHDGPEECIVIEGEVCVGAVRMRAGDYQRAEPGSHHIAQRTETGALLYITAPLSLLSDRKVKGD